MEVFPFEMSKYHTYMIKYIILKHRDRLIWFLQADMILIISNKGG